MIKLYKRTESEVLYWEVWDGQDGSVTVHWGTLGTTGEARPVSIPRGQSAEQIIAKESAQPLTEGYAEIDDDDLAQIIIQYQTEGEWGDEQDLDKRHQVEDVLNECLGWTGNGHCDGGDIGSGTMNAFCLVVDPELAVKTIIDTLKSENLLEGAVIALDTEEETQVLWPEDFEGEFSVL